MMFDLRLLAVRTDLADSALRNMFLAPRYADPCLAFCAVPFVPIRSAPGGERTSELLHGERFMVLDDHDGWSWGWCAHDHYVGYVESVALGDALPFNEKSANDSVEAAMRYVDMPYLLSGRGGAGIDCSGLIQRSFAATGFCAPRDSDMQRNMGNSVGATEPLQRGDLIGFAGHIGMMIDQLNLIHATSHWGRVLVEPLEVVENRTKILTRARLCYPSVTEEARR
ncbi:MAG: C40 family peptidase [Kineosporiaceae bacterium]|nr:C40 family peptidase [Aeromicrobium sp.]